MPVYTPNATINVRDLNPTVGAGTSVTGTSAAAVLITVNLPNTAALYEMIIVTSVGGTVTSTEANNMVLKQGSTTLMTLPVAQSAGSSSTTTVIVNSAVSTSITVVVGAATPGASASYNVSAVARQVSA